MVNGSPIGKLRRFSVAEYDRRLHSARHNMQEQSLDLLLVFNPENVLFLSGYQSIGFSSFLTLVVPATGDLIILMREMEIGCAQYYAWVDDLIPFSDHEDPVEVLLQALSQRDLDKGVVGMELDAAFIGTKRMTNLRQRLAAREIIDASGTIEKTRRIKSAEELVYIRQACRATEAGMKAGIETAQAGATENEVAAAMFAATLSAGSTFMSSQPIVTSGPRSGVAHTTFDNRRIESGDVVLLELGGCVNRYSGALMRSLAVGNVSDEAHRMAEACEAGLVAALEALRPGVTCGEVDAACLAQIVQAGFEANFRKRTGYSVGVSYPPDWGEGHILSLRHGDPTLIEPGMVFHIPPALREFGRWGVGTSETVLVTADGNELLTHFPRQFFQH